MHYVTAKGILSAKNGMNLYRGCQHGCIYCDSRSDCYHMEHDFEDIEVKENALVLLENALRRKRKPCMIGTGSMSDPYMPLEEELQYTRKALELIFPIWIRSHADHQIRPCSAGSRPAEGHPRQDKMRGSDDADHYDEELAASWNRVSAPQRPGLRR